MLESGTDLQDGSKLRLVRFCGLVGEVLEQRLVLIHLADKIERHRG